MRARFALFSRGAQGPTVVTVVLVGGTVALRSRCTQQGVVTFNMGLESARPAAPPMAMGRPGTGRYFRGSRAPGVVRQRHSGQ